MPDDADRIDVRLKPLILTFEFSNDLFIISCLFTSKRKFVYEFNVSCTCTFTTGNLPIRLPFFFAKTQVGSSALWLESNLIFIAILKPPYGVSLIIGVYLMVNLQGRLEEIRLFRLLIVFPILKNS